MSGDAGRAIRSVAVAGGGIVGLSTAIAFARALPPVRVTLIDLPADPAALADRMPSSSPVVGRFHAAIGLDERDLVRAGIATHHLGTRFEHWSADGTPWVHVFGSYGQPAGAVPFDQIWARAREAGRVRPYHLHSPAAMLAEAGKFVHPSRDPQPLSTFTYGLRLDPDLYRRRLEAQAAASRIELMRGDIGAIEHRADGAIAALLLEDGRRVEADLYIDCSGPSARLLSSIDDGFEDWGDVLPCDRLLLGAGPGPDIPAPAARFAATDIGWHAQWPLRGRTLKALGFASMTDEEEARRQFGTEPAERVAIRPGRRPRPWLRNVLAIGDAAIAVDPLGGFNLDLAQNAIIRAFELLPGRDGDPLELREYNRRTELMTRRVHDFLALHYLRSGRRAGRFWTDAARKAPPDSLAVTLDQYEARGRLPFHEEESITRNDWTAALLGMGVLPRATDAVAAGVPFEDSVAAMERLAREAGDLAARLPSYGDYLARMARAAPARQPI
jgi:tryptophan halogenase